MGVQLIQAVMNFRFDPDMLNTIAGGRSAIDMSRLQIHSLEGANAFLKAYGFDYNDPRHVETLWQQHRRSLVLMTEKLGIPENDIPLEIRERKNLQDIRLLLLFASRLTSDALQPWACAILRCMHVFMHAENDLFSFFAKEIQEQILSQFESVIYHEGSQIFLSGASLAGNRIEILHFQTKPFKNTSSAVIKLLARPDALAMRVFDKIGIRFVTKSVFDSFRLIRFLVEENRVSFPHIMPDQSSNNVFPVDLFVKVCHQLEKNQISNPQEIEKILEAELKLSNQDLLRKPNDQSDRNFRFIKFISRQLIRIQPQDQAEGFHFFYPFEIQIMDENSYQLTQSGPVEHAAYKERQTAAARARVFPFPLSKGTL
jgi:uncharacterized protein (TIGR04552 family)